MHAQHPTSQRQPSHLEEIKDRGGYEILEAGKPWALLGQGYQLTADSAVDKDGNVYFTDARKNRILKIDLDLAGRYQRCTRRRFRAGWPLICRAARQEEDCRFLERRHRISDN